jgi:hypothetical protein
MKFEDVKTPHTLAECRCDERLKTKDEESTRLTYTGWVPRGTGTPKDKDEVNRKLILGQTPRLCNLPRKSYSNINVPCTSGSVLVEESRQVV